MSTDAARDATIVKLRQHLIDLKSKTCLKELLKDEKRNAEMMTELPGFVFDYSRQFVTKETMDLLFELAMNTRVKEQITAMAHGEHLNTTEDRAVMHMALRAGVSKPSASLSSSLVASDPAGDAFTVDGDDVVKQARAVQQSIEAFSASIRGGEQRGATGRVLDTVVCVGIGGSFLGAKFVYEALRCDQRGGGVAGCAGRQLRFLANVDPVDVARALEGLDPERTLVLVLSKTFTTAETMLNARTVRQWLVEGLAAAGCTDAGAVVAKHMAACSTATDKCAAFGLAPERVFAFWDWVGGRYSVTSAVGLLPLALHFGWPVVQAFLAGARDMDHHFLTAPLQANVPVLMALLGVWNSQFQGLPARAIAPYTEALCELAAHVQQVDMESNGKTVRKDGTRAPVLGADGQQARDERGEPRWEAFGEVDFGQAGTNAQHSFFQLFHQGRVVPVDFIGAVHSQHDRRCHENPRLSNHDELMCNFFAQPDALATGRDHADPHRAMSGNRPSSVLLWTQVSAYEVGALLSLYEHRTAVQGFVWGINSFDQFGVELGKVLATRVRDAMDKARRGVPEDQSDLPSSTRALLGRYMAATSKL